jgi:hypothetical protein
MKSPKALHNRTEARTKGWRRTMAIFLACAFAVVTLWASFPTFHGHTETVSGHEDAWQNALPSELLHGDCGLCQWHASAQATTKCTAIASEIAFHSIKFNALIRHSAAPGGLLDGVSPRGPPVFFV